MDDPQKRPQREYEKDDVTIPFDDSDAETTPVNRSPINIGSGKATKPSQSTSPTQKVKKQPSSSPDRISGMKIFYVKLHAGAIDFLEEQVRDWLAANPGIVVKKTNVTTGDVVAKKTEPNLIMTVWY